MRLAADGELVGYPHEGFFYAMDTYREYRALNDLWERGEAPWKVWRRGGGFGSPRPLLGAGRPGRGCSWPARGRACPSVGWGAPARRRGGRGLPGARLGAPERAGAGPADRPGEGRPRRRPRPGDGRAGPGRVRGRHGLPPGGPDDRRDRQPQPGLDLRVEHPG